MYSIGLCAWIVSNVSLQRPMFRAGMERVYAEACRQACVYRTVCT